MTINESMLDYLDEFLDEQGKGKYWTKVDWLKVELNETSISQNPMMNGGVISRDILGNETKSQAFTYSLVFPYTEDVYSMLRSGKMLEDLQDYVKVKPLPILEKGRIAEDLSVSQTPYLAQIEDDNTKGIYVVILELKYIEPRKAKER